MENERLREYIAMAYSFPSYSIEEENELIKQIMKNKNTEAKKELINSCLKIVVKTARKYFGWFNINPLELIQEGNIGLIKSIPKFEIEKGVAFSYYTSFRIKAAILDLLIKEEFSQIKFPIRKTQLFRRFNKVKKIIIRDNNGSFSLEKAAEKMDISVKKLKELLLYIYEIQTISENTPINDSPKPIEIKDSLSFSNKNIINPEKNTQKKDPWKKVREVFSYLTPREEKILRMIFGIGEKKEYTFREIKNLFGISRMRVYQIKKRAFEKSQKRFVTGTKKFEFSDYL